MMTNAELISLSLRDAAAALRDGSTTSTALCTAFLERIQAVEPKVRALLAVNPESVLAQAAASDARRAVGAPLGEFDGIPITLKDNICAKDEQCSCASKILKGFVSPYDAFVTSKLKAAGCVLLGRANMDEFAMGSSCENSAYQKTANPWNLDCVPGGSSGGSAASVAATIRKTPQRAPLRSSSRSMVAKSPRCRPAPPCASSAA